jgi:hypothetical protein
MPTNPGTPEFLAGQIGSALQPLAGQLTPVNAIPC